MTISTLSEEMLSAIWSPEKYDPEWKSEFLQTLNERCKDSNNVIGEWLCGKLNRPGFPRHFPSSGNSAFQNPLAIAA